MDYINHNSEKGQAIVYLVIGLVVFLGFVAMAIDGGMALADRRHMQNAADAGSLAGGGMAARSLEVDNVTDAGWDCYSGSIWDAIDDAETAAIARTEENINLDASLGDALQVTAYCEEKYIELTVDVTATTPSNFLQLIFPDALKNKVNAVTRIYPRRPVSPGNAIIALNPQICSDPGSDGGVFYSNQGADLNIYNGSVYSNGCLRCNGSPNIVVECDYDTDPECDPDALGSWGSETRDCSGTWTPPPDINPGQIPALDFNFEAPDCTAADATNMTATDLEKLLNKNHPYDMDAGLWCISGNLTINSTDNLTGADVTIYMRNGDFTINGTPQVTLSAPPASSHPLSAIPGVLIYVPAPNPYNPNLCTNHVVKLNGTETSTFTGSIMAPCSLVTLNGTGGNTYQGQIIGWNVEVGGDADLNLTYNADYTPHLSTRMDLYK